MELLDVSGLLGTYKDIMTVGLLTIAVVAVALFNFIGHNQAKTFSFEDVDSREVYPRKYQAWRN